MRSYIRGAEKVKLNWFLTVADEFGTLRTIHPAAFNEAQRTLLQSLIVDYLFVPIGHKVAADGTEIIEVAASKKKMLPVIDPKDAAMMTQGEIARESGFTGDVCKKCGGFHMVRSGTCVTCADCGDNDGCS